MKYRLLAGWVVGLALTASMASVNCGGDDDEGTTSAGTAGSAGKAGAGGSGGAGGAGTAGKGGTAGSGTAGKGGTAGSGTAGSAGSGTAGSAGTGGSAGTAGTGGTGGQTDASTDAPTDAPRVDGSTGDGSRSDAGDSSVSSDASDSSTSETSTSDATSSDAPDGSVAFSAVRAILSARCTGCHRPRDAGQQLVDFLTDTGLYDRLIAPLPDNQEGTCGFGDAGTDGGDAAPQNRRMVVPSDPGASFLYLKLAGTQPAGEPSCGVRMPRIRVTAEDGGPAGTVGCDQADGGAAGNCLSQSDLDLILHWIEQGAPNN